MKLTLFLALAASALLVDAAQMSRHRHGLLKARQGTVTDTNACTTDTDCASGCCGFTKAVCEGPCVALQRDGCGHGDAGSNSNAASQLGECSSLVAAYTPSSLAGAPAATATSAATSDSGCGAAPADTPASTTDTASTARGTQFITGACTTNNDCVSGCCVTAKDTCGAVGAQANGAADCIGGVSLPNLNTRW